MAAILSRRQCVNRTTEINIIEKIITPDNSLLSSKHLTVKRIYNPYQPLERSYFISESENVPHLWLQLYIIHLVTVMKIV